MFHFPLMKCCYDVIHNVFSCRTPSIKHIGLSASKFEDWEGAGSGNIQSMFKKVAALNNSRTLTKKVDTSFGEDGAVLFPQVSGAAARNDCLMIAGGAEPNGSSVSDMASTNENNSEIAGAAAHIENSVIDGTVSSDNPNGINKYAAGEVGDKEKGGGSQTTSPGSSFFKNFILKRQQKLNSANVEDVQIKDNSCSPIKPCSSSYTDDDGNNNLKLLVNCLENDSDNSNDSSGADLDETHCEVVETLSSSIEVCVVEEEDKAKNESSKSLSPDLFSSYGSNECGDVAELNKDYTKNDATSTSPGRDILLNISVESHGIACEDFTPTGKVRDGVKNTPTKSVIPPLSPETPDQSFCQVSVEELFPNLDDFDSSLLPFLPNGLREKVEVELTRYKAKLQSSSDGDAGILKYVQKIPSETCSLSKSSMCNTPLKSANIALAVDERNKKNEAEKGRNGEVKRVHVEVTKNDGESTSGCQIYTNKGGKGASNYQSKSKAGKASECQNDVRIGKGVAVICQSIQCQDETDCEESEIHDEGERDMVECQECGKSISPFDLPEHLDFHVALKLQSDLRHEESRSGLEGPGNPRPGSRTVSTKSNRGKKRGRPSKGDMENHKLQKIDTFFTR